MAVSQKKPIGRALIVGSPSARSQPLAAMQALGYECAEVDDPYAAMLELLRRPMVYWAVVLSLSSLFKEELAMVATLKRRLPKIEIWLTHIEGRQAAMAETMRHGADGLLDEDGVLHRMAVQASEIPKMPANDAPPQPLADSSVIADTEAIADTGAAELTPAEADALSPMEGEPVLSADELHALLAEQPEIDLEPEGESQE